MEALAERARASRSGGLVAREADDQADHEAGKKET